MNVQAAPHQVSVQKNSTSSSSIQQPLKLNPIDFERHFGREPFLIEHDFCDNELFQMDRLVELARTLPSEHIEYNAGNIPVSMEKGASPQNGLSPEETIRRIRECQSWLVLKYVDQDPEYQQLLSACLDQLKPYTEPLAPGMTQPQAFVFVTSPGSVTPYHIDPEHNFLLQIQGTKQIRMLDGRDKSILSEEDLEQFYSDRGRNLKLDEANNEAGWTYNLQPGQGLHFPVTYPHWVQNGEEVSISFSITFRTPDLDRRRALYEVNRSLRDKGFFPWPVGKNKLRDQLFYNGYRAMRKAKQLAFRKN